jgi:hypothetical protein
MFLRRIRDLQLRLETPSLAAFRNTTTISLPQLDFSGSSKLLLWNEH